MTLRRAVGVLIGSLVLVGPLAGVGAAARPTPPTPAAAGASVDLSRGWGAYNACLVKPDGSTECFADAKGMKARSNQLAPIGLAPNSQTSMAASSSGWCPVYLFSGAYYTGRVLELTGRGFWINMSDFGFNKMTVSFYGYGCGFHLAESWWGGGRWYPGYTGPWAYAGDMGGYGWDYRVSSAYIS